MAALLQIPNIKVHRISCPYCLVGYAEVVEERKQGQVQIAGIKDPRKCVTCNRYFKLKPVMKLIGVAWENGNG